MTLVSPCGPREPGQVPPSVASLLPGYGLIHVVDSSGRDRVEEAEAELIKMTNQNEMNDAVVFVFCQHTHTLRGNSFGKDDDRRAQEWEALVVVC